MSHAYILAGETDYVRAYAMNMAKTLNCLAENTTPCGECLSCRVFDSGNHPDVLYVVGTKATGIGVEDVRDQVIVPMATQPFRYQYKIFIMDKAETLTPAAQNALLKTIEEPAPYGVFLLLVAQTDKLLPTVLSRCVVHKIAPDAAQTISVKDVSATDIDALVAEVIGMGEPRDVLDALALYKRFEPYKDNRDGMRALLLGLYDGYGRLVSAAYANGGRPDLHWFTCAKAIIHTKQVLQQNGNFQLAIEVLLLTLNKHTKGVIA